MSTRVRVLLKYGGATNSRGRKAIVDALMLALNSRFVKNKLNTFPGRTKVEKLTSLGMKLPVPYSLILFREMRGLRRNKSLYWAHITGRVGQNAEPR